MHAVTCGPLAGLGVGKCGLCSIARGHGGIELLLADHVLLYQRLVARQIGLGLG